MVVVTASAKATMTTTKIASDDGVFGYVLFGNFLLNPSKLLWNNKRGMYFLCRVRVHVRSQARKCERALTHTHSNVCARMCRFSGNPEKVEENG